MAYPLEALYSDVAQIQHGSRNAFGSGRLVGPNLILTARHVLTFETPNALLCDGWKVRLLSGRSRSETWEWSDATLAWAGADDLDLALLLVSPPAREPVWKPLLRICIAEIRTVKSHRVRCLGFPRGARIDNA